MTIRILVSDKISSEGINQLEKKGYQVTKGWDMPKPDLPKIIGDYDVLIVADEHEVFGPYLPYRTWDPRPVAGTAGLLIFSIALVILELKKLELADYLPSLVVAPVLAWLFLA